MFWPKLGFRRKNNIVVCDTYIRYLMLRAITTFFLLQKPCTPSPSTSLIYLQRRHLTSVAQCRQVCKVRGFWHVYQQTWEKKQKPMCSISQVMSGECGRQNALSLNLFWHTTKTYFPPGLTKAISTELLLSFSFPLFTLRPFVDTGPLWQVVSLTSSELIFVLLLIMVLMWAGFLGEKSLKTFKGSCSTSHQRLSC